MNFFTVSVLTIFFYASLTAQASSVRENAHQERKIAIGLTSCPVEVMWNITDFLDVESVSNFSATNRGVKSLVQLQIQKILGAKNTDHLVRYFLAPAPVFLDSCTGLYGYPREDFIAASLSLPQDIEHRGILFILKKDRSKDSYFKIIVNQLVALQDKSLTVSFLRFLLLTDAFADLSNEQTLKFAKLDVQNLELSPYIAFMPISPKSLTVLGELGCTDIQDYVADNLASERNGFTRDSIELKRLADLGWKNAQGYIAEWFFRSNSTNFCDEDVRKKLGDLGWKESRGIKIFANSMGGYAVSISTFGAGPVFFGGEDIQKDPMEGRRLAELDWKNARYYTAEGLTFGIYGFTQDLNELRKLAHLGWEKAQGLLAEGLAEGIYGFTQDLNELRKLAHLGWKTAQELFLKGITEGIYGFAQDPDELSRLAHLGWEEAQKLFLKGITEGIYGVDQDPDELRRLANLGWKTAQKLLLKGLSEGIFGFSKNLREIKMLNNIDWNQVFSDIYGNAADSSEFRLNEDAIKVLADLGHTRAQDCILYGVAFGDYEVDQKVNELKRFIHLGWEDAQDYLDRVIDGNIYAEDNINHKKIKEYADFGCQYAGNFIINAVLLGAHGFTQDISEVRKLLEKYEVNQNSFDTFLQQNHFSLAILALNNLLARKKHTEEVT